MWLCLALFRLPIRSLERLSKALGVKEVDPTVGSVAFAFFFWLVPLLWCASIALERIGVLR